MIMIDRLIEQALLEDIHTGDITTLAVVPGKRPASARLIAKEVSGGGWTCNRSPGVQHP